MPRGAESRGAGPPPIRYTVKLWYILGRVAKHLVDIDERTLHAARRRLGTKTIKATVNQALMRVAADDKPAGARLDVLARADLAPRERAWR